MRIGVDVWLHNSITTHNDGAAGAICEAKERIRRENLMNQYVGCRGNSAADAAAATNAANNTDKWLFDMRWRDTWSTVGGGWSGITMGGRSDN